MYVYKQELLSVTENAYDRDQRLSRGLTLPYVHLLSSSLHCSYIEFL